MQDPQAAACGFFAFGRIVAKTQKGHICFVELMQANP
jgi:hypothetical protein